MAELDIDDGADAFRVISLESPCGPYLEFDPSFRELRKAVEGKPETGAGKLLLPAIPPDWKAARALASGLLERSLDLRFAVPYAWALLNTEGFAGFAQGLLIIQQLLTRHWEALHPRLDPDDDYDPTARVNILSTLAAGTTVLKDISTVPLIASHAHGRFSLRDIDAATRPSDPPNASSGNPVNDESRIALINAALHDADQEALKGTIASLQTASIRAAKIEALLVERVGPGQSVDLSPLIRLLERAHSFLATHMAPVTPPLAPEVSERIVPPGLRSPAVALTVPPTLSLGEIASRDDVVKAIDQLCAYYARHEPSSPVPLVLMRAQRLVKMNFLEIMQELAPDSLTQIYQVSGSRNET